MPGYPRPRGQRQTRLSRAARARSGSSANSYRVRPRVRRGSPGGPCRSPSPHSRQTPPQATPTATPPAPHTQPVPDVRRQSRSHRQAEHEPGQPRRPSPARGAEHHQRRRRHRPVNRQGQQRRGQRGLPVGDRQLLNMDEETTAAIAATNRTAAAVSLRTAPRRSSHAARHVADVGPQPADVVLQLADALLGVAEVLAQAAGRGLVVVVPVVLIGVLA